MQHVAYAVTNTGIVVFFDGKSLPPVNTDHPSFEAIKLALKEKRYSDLPKLMDLPTAIAEYVAPLKDDGFETVDGVIHLNGEPFSEGVSEKVLRMIKEGYESTPLVNFLRKVRENPSYTAQKELLLFWTANGGLIHEDGDMVAYKAVRNDYMDAHSGTIRNQVGDLVTMPRHQVDDCRANTCSTGLHFATSHYVAQMYTGGNRNMLLKINPRDVVSIPHDYNNRKGRCCRYEVMAELENTQTTLPPKEVYNDADIAAVDQTATLNTSRILDRVNKVLAKLVGRDAQDIRGTDTFGSDDEGDLDVDPKQAIEAFEEEFKTEDLEFDEGDFLDGDTVNDLVETIVDLMQEDEDEDEELFDNDFDDEDEAFEPDLGGDDLFEVHDDESNEGWLDDMMEALKDNILTRRVNTHDQFIAQLKAWGLDPKSDVVKEAATRANIAQWL